MYSHRAKFIGIALIALLTPLGYFVYPGNHDWTGVSQLVALGLAMFFFAKESVEDERVQQLKFRALAASFSAGLSITMVVNYMIYNMGMSRGDFLRSISAFDFMIMILIMSILLFYYWRHEDAASPA